MCIVNGLVPNPATTVINGQSVCSTHINDVIAAPGSQGLTISRMKPETPAEKGRYYGTNYGI